MIKDKLGGNHLPKEGFEPPLIGPEKRKRKREIFAIFLISFSVVFLTWFEIRLLATSQQLPFRHSIFFFGLVNFNIILLLLLFFLIFRNLVKVFVERKSRVFGSSLKAKLIAAFVAFSSIPTLLIFTISVFYINSSFDKWFNAKMASVLKSSLEVTNEFYFASKKRNYHFAYQIAQVVASQHRRDGIQKKMDHLRDSYSLDAIEYYPSLFSKRMISVGTDDRIPEIPSVPMDFLQKGIKEKHEASTIHQFADGNLVRVIVPVEGRATQGAIVVSTFVPLSLLSKVNDITAAYDEFRDVNPLEYPIKSIYLIILFLMTIVILLAATWFGFYLARQLSIPLVQLGRATRRVADGDYSPLTVTSGSEEITLLISSFNEMTADLAHSQRAINNANQALSDHSRYVEVVLGSISAGVISVDESGVLTTINRRAGELLKINPLRYIGCSIKELLTMDQFNTLYGLLETLQGQSMGIIQKEVPITIEGVSIPLQINLSQLRDENDQEIGKVMVFDDMTPIVNAQRAAAWTEVARRIAHEIKNPLTPIKLSAERLQRKFQGVITDPAFDECTKMIINQVDGLKILVNEFSNFARLPQAKPVVGSLIKITEESLSVFKQAHPNVCFITEYDADLPDFKFDPNQMKRVLVNLIDNAIAAIQKEPKPVVQVQIQYNRELKIVRLIVADNGEGISAANRVRIFEPYFSTKETGTGLGLPIVKRIIEDHSGFIRATGNDPKGARMVIELPLLISS